MSKKETLSVVVEEPYVNSIGQTVMPGDTVVAVTTGYGHYVSTFTGVFRGVRRSKETNAIVGAHIDSIPYVVHEREYCDDGESEETRYNYKTRQMELTGRRFNTHTKTVYSKTNLQRNRMFKI